jgi:23S rRNA (guanine745-N1)-methyltransferase
VVPGPRHLWELKQLLYEHPYENEEKQEEYPGFALDAVVPVETGFTLTDNEQIRALFHMTPYTWKTPKDAKQRLETVQALSLTAQFRIHVFTRRPEDEK